MSALLAAGMLGHVHHATWPRPQSIPCRASGSGCPSIVNSTTRRAALLHVLAGSAALCVPPGANAAVSDADAAYAAAEIVACREYLRAVTNLARAQAFEEARPALFRPPFSQVNGAVDALTDRVEGLNEQNAALSVSLRNLAAALKAEDWKQARAASRDAAEALDAMKGLLTTAGLLQ